MAANLETTGRTVPMGPDGHGDLGPQDLAQVGWDLEPLLDGGTGRTGLEVLLAKADTLAADLQTRRGTIARGNAVSLSEVMHAVAAIHDLLGRSGNYAQLGFAIDTATPERGALLAFVEERSVAISSSLLFIELEWLDATDEHAAGVLADPVLAFCAHYLRTARRFRPHVRTEPEERMLAEKSIAASSAWVRLFEESMATLRVEVAGESLVFEDGFSRLFDSDRSVRRAASEAITQTLQPGLRQRAYVYNVLMADRAVEDRLRAYPTWCSSRNLGNQASDDSVRALIEAVVARSSIARRWYGCKARLLGLERLADYDRMAPVGRSEAAVVSWADARSIVLDAYRSFSPELGSVASRFFAEGWIDAPTREAKQSGAFCSPAVPSAHPYVMVNFTETREDVLTLAHELGHGLHFALSRGQSVFHHMTPLTLAETASVFGETLAFNRLLEQERNPTARLSLLAQNIESQIATVFRQVAMWRFEDLAHTARRTHGEVSVESLNNFWAETQTELLGDTVELTEGYRSWWSYIPHFVHTPGYVYAYAFGQLLALSVYRRYEEEGTSFVPRYLELLAAGGSAPPEVLAAQVGCDLSDPAFWNAGLDLVERVLAQAEQAAAVSADV